MGQLVLLYRSDAGRAALQGSTELRGLPTLGLADAAESIELLVELGEVAPADWLARFRARAGQVVHVCLEQPHAALAEPMLFRAASRHVCLGHADQVWVQSTDQAFAPMLRTLHRRPVFAMPFVWSPEYVKRRAKALELAGDWYGYRRRAAATGWRVAIVEPNVSIARSCMAPLLICDLAYRAQPAAVAALRVLDTAHIRQHPTLVCLANSLDLVRHHKAAFLGAEDVPAFLARHADAVVAHQWNGGHDHLHIYLDLLHGDYPLVHNSPWLGGAGYDYQDFDLQAGAQQLLQALHAHEEGIEDYRARTASLMASVEPRGQANVDACARLLLGLGMKEQAN